MLMILKEIARRFNNENITWGVGASLMLTFYGLNEGANDIDISVTMTDIDRANSILSDMGQKKERINNSDYSTKYFYEYEINGIDIDVMGGLRINHDEGNYNFEFDQSSVTKYKIIDDIKIPLVSLEDWYVLYQLIPNREKKVKTIEDYLKTEGIKNPTLLKNALEKELPIIVKKRIEKIL